ncbi:MAG: type III secretion system gatekeeper subunit SctW [Chlamydiales bacterium]
MQDDNLKTSRIGSVESERTQRAQKPEQTGRFAMQAEMVEEEFTQWTELAAFNPLAMARRFETLEIRTRKKGREEEPEKTAKEKGIVEIERIEEVAGEFHRKNEELSERTLLLLRARLSDKETKESVHKKLLESYTDLSLADEALDFLIETSDGDLNRAVREVKEEITTQYGREIRAGKNIAAQAREFSTKGLGSPTALRDIYRDIIGNPRDALTLFEQLTSAFSFEKMKVVIEFVLHSLGADLKAKGSSISRAELHRLLTEARSLQAILGVFRFFVTRMNIIGSLFKKNGLAPSPRINFETLAKVFMKYLQERYPASEKVLQLAAQLGISEEIAQVIIFTQMRDAVRQVAPKLYRTPQQRQDVLMSFIEALEDLEEKMEEKEEKEEGEKK